MTDPLQSQRHFSRQILSWYDDHARELPWRSKPGIRPDPYHVWLSEIMLQQTTVATVGPYFEKFLTMWPTVGHMAAAPLDKLLTAWAGLGYYARARNLHKCAIAVQENFNGIFPCDESDLLSLPGIGPYTAAAISSIAFDQAATVVDGNIERIMARLFRIKEPLPAAKKTITDLAEQLTPAQRPGDYAQALMDIGATICMPRKPKCETCPISVFCEAFDAKNMETYPVKAIKKAKPKRRAFIFWLEAANGDVLLRRREESGLLGGMMEFPSSPWKAELVSLKEALVDYSEFLLPNSIFREKAVVRHTFTHFHLELKPVFIHVKKESFKRMKNISWVQPGDFSNYALPTLMIKVVKSVQDNKNTSI
jgi:A/G-specific adenine glycosylase